MAQHATHDRMTAVVCVPPARCPRCGGPLTSPALAWPKRKPEPSDIGICSKCVNAALYVMAIRTHGHVPGAPGQVDDEEDRVGNSRIPSQDDRLDMRTKPQKVIWRA